MGEKFDCLRISNQLCFPLYACSKEIVKRYKPYLDPLDLTYTQYITMMVVWEEKEITVKALGDKLFLDSGTLTPVLKKLEQKGYVKRVRSKDDERNLIITLTKEGDELKKQASEIPAKMGHCVKLSREESSQLYNLLYKVLGQMEPEA
ncbi:MarR family winged helix-turn-helix transcriptional regulator [Pseudobutyrivibrio sp.]|uniref:MarR family winged helix-turn-helix transcriptional regulator n=1 Tax=Pseudobutyrivibrio sp. TaxID=2014367 RepID=UPI0025F11DCC|nr:MarR family transcriptional regulator [Pseudobutyrivibrio sp.]MBR5649653.1 MarR family transcriptional regulator [Pseudobutyrivibrio sp.]